MIPGMSAVWADAISAAIIVLESIPAIWFLCMYGGLVWERRPARRRPSGIGRLAVLPLLLRAGPALVILRALIRTYFLVVQGGYRAALPFGSWTPIGPDLAVGGVTVFYAWFYLWVFVHTEEPVRGERRR